MSEYDLSEKIRPGSSLYYSLRLVPVRKRNAVKTLFAWFLTVEGILDSSDFAVAEKKFAWWQAEMAHLRYNSKPMHPLSRTLMQIMHRFQLPFSPLETLVECLSNNLSVVSYAHTSTMEQYAGQTLLVLHRLAAQVLLRRALHTEEETIVRQLSLAMFWMRMIARLRQDAVRGHIYLPQDQLAGYGVGAQQLLHPAITPEGLKLMLTHEIDIIRDRLAQMRALSGNSRRALSPLLILALLNWRTLKVQMEDGLQLFERKVGITPLHKLLLSTRLHWSLRFGHIHIQ